MFFNEAPKVIWFTQDKDGYQVLHRPDGTNAKGKEKCLPSDQILCYREKARLFMQECGIWDGTSFACTVQTLFFLKPTSHKTYLFCGLDGAERFVYSMLPIEIVKASRKFVDDFYASPSLQAGWPGYLMFPVWFEVSKGSDELKPVFIGDIGATQSAVSNYEICNIGCDLANLKNVFDPVAVEDETIIFHDPDKEYGFMSNWYKSDFYAEGHWFSSVEQYLMYHKALLFSDSVTAELILNDSSPAAIQQLGRKVTPYNDKVWDSHCQIILYRALGYKFTQNTDLRLKLLATGNSTLVEGTKTDKRFANGLTRDDPDRYNISKWPGRNLLGFTLMEVRDDLKA